MISEGNSEKVTGLRMGAFPLNVNKMSKCKGPEVGKCLVGLEIGKVGVVERRWVSLGWLWASDSSAVMRNLGLLLEGNGRLGRALSRR